MPTLEIFDKENGFLSFDLCDLLAVIAPFASRLDWYVVEFEPAVLAGRQHKAKDFPPSWITELWQKGETGSVQALSWERLKELATHVTQTLNALLIATENGTSLPNSSLGP